MFQNGRHVGKNREILETRIKGMKLQELSAQSDRLEELGSGNIRALSGLI